MTAIHQPQASTPAVTPGLCSEILAITADWRAAETRFKAAEAAYAPYANEVRIPEDIRKELAESYRNLMSTPAPDAKALRWKLREILEDAEENCSMADFDRLCGEA